MDTEADDSQVLAAAHSDLIASQHALHEIDPALSIDDAVVSVEDGSQPCLVVRVVGPSGDGRDVRLSRTALLRARDARVPRSICPITLVACALAVPDDLDASWRPKRVGLAEAPDRELLNVYVELFRLTNSARKAERALEDGADMLLIGKHGSGKTAIAARSVEFYQLSGEGVIWLDLSDPADSPESILVTLMRTPRRKKYLLVVDGVHANLPVVDRILSCVPRLRSEFGLSVQVLATGWHTVAPRLPETFKSILKIPVQGEEMIEQLVASALDTQASTAIRALAGGDIYLAGIALKFYRERRRVPTRRDLQRALTREVVDPEVRHALYWLACLCFFEIDVSIGLTRSRFATEADWLLAHGLIRASDSSYTIGPRARAALLLRHALDEWDAERQWGRPAELTWQYLQRHGERAIRALLSRLDLGGVTRDVQDTTRYLLSAWEMQGRLEGHLEALCKKDPQWGDRVGAAAFAAMALAASERTDAWRPVAKYLRRRWGCQEGENLPLPKGGPTADFSDFDKIHQRMAEQDRLLGDAPHLAGQRAEDIDPDWFYRTWVLGLLLGVEGTAPASERRPDLIGKLVELAAQAQDPAGFFYPQRVSFNTARIVLGLCAMGETIDTSRTVRNACSWLLRPVSEGGAFDLWWRSGTGPWNSDELTTAICLTALFHAGVREGPEIDSALTWLVEQEARWTSPGRDIDLAHVLEALLLAPSRPANPYIHVDALLVRTLRAHNNPANPVDLGQGIPEEGHRMPFATYQLASLVWTMVNREFTKLLDDVIEADGRQGQYIGAQGGQGQPRETSEPMRTPAELPPTEPTPAPANGVLNANELLLWREAADQLRKKINGEIEERDGLPPNKAIQNQLEELLTKRATAERLIAELRDDTPPETLTELDGLGRDVCGAVWPDQLPRPGIR